MITLSIANTQLTNTILIAKKERIHRASVFPFFSKSEQVKQLMIVLPDSKTVFLIPFKKGLATVSFFGVIRLSMDSAELKSHSNFTLWQVSHLYHYDPNWLLSHERFSNYWAKKRITQSNCAHCLGEKVRQLLFSRDLSLLEGFVMKYGLLNTHRTIEPEVLSGPIHPTEPEKSDLCIEPVNCGWQLNPIWNEWAKSGRR
jgi:hypothetical protein